MGDEDDFSLFCFKDQFISPQVCIGHCGEPLLDLINVRIRIKVVKMITIKFTEYFANPGIKNLACIVCFNAHNTIMWSFSLSLPHTGNPGFGDGKQPQDTQLIGDKVGIQNPSCV